MLRKTNPIKMMLIKTNVTHKQSDFLHDKNITTAIQNVYIIYMCTKCKFIFPVSFPEMKVSFSFSYIVLHIYLFYYKISVFMYYTSRYIRLRIHSWNKTQKKIWRLKKEKKMLKRNENMTSNCEILFLFHLQSS